MTVQFAHHAFREELAENVEPQVTIHSYYYTVLKRRWIVLAVALAIWLVAAILAFVQTPIYKSTVLIQVDGTRINLIQGVTIDDGRASSADLYATQEKILRSRALARGVVEELELWKLPFFRGSIDPSDTEARASLVKTAVSKLLAAMEAVHIRRTHLIEVSFLTPDPKLSARLANTLSQQYIRFSAAEESGLARNTSTFILEQVEELRGHIREKENLLREYSRNEEIAMGGSTDSDIVFQRLEELNRQLTRAVADRAAAQARFRSLENVDPLTILEVRNAASVRNLLQTHDHLAEELAKASTRFKSDWPEIKRLESSLDQAQARLDARLKAEAVQVKAEARMAYHAARQRELLLRQSLDEQKGQSRPLRRVAADYGQMQGELDNQRDMLQTLLRKQSEANLNAEFGERQSVNVRIVDYAEVAESPFSPNVFLNLFVGGLLGIALGIGVAFILDSVDRSIFTLEDLKRDSHLPYLGMIPRLTAPESGRSVPLRALRANRTRSEFALRDSSRLETTSGNVLGERFRFLRDSLLLSTPGMVPKVVLVSSPDQNSGKTFVSSNLGGAFVQMGKPVLLVDADLRSPELHKVFKYQNRVGLTNVLTRQKPLWAMCVMRTDVPDLFLLMAGPRSPNPGELLGSTAMAETLKECARHFDVVIVDSAPLLPVFDTHTLTRLADATILVVRSGTTTRQALRTSTELIERVRGKVTGVVLNDVDLSDYAQSYYHSSYTYEYSHYA